MTIKTNKHDKTYQEQMPKSFFQKGCCNHYLYTVYNTTSFFLTSLVILIKLNLIALLPNLLFFCVQQTKHDPLASNTPSHCLKHFNFCCQLFPIKDFVLMELNQKLLTWVKTCHL